MKRSKGCCGVSVIEALLVLCVVLLAALLWRPVMNRLFPPPARCVSSLKSVGTAMRIYMAPRPPAGPTTLPPGVTPPAAAVQEERETEP